MFLSNHSLVALGCAAVTGIVLTLCNRPELQKPSHVRVLRSKSLELFFVGIDIQVVTLWKERYLLYDRKEEKHF